MLVITSLVLKREFGFQRIIMTWTIMVTEALLFHLKLQKRDPPLSVGMFIGFPVVTPKTSHQVLIYRTDKIR